MQTPLEDHIPPNRFVPCRVSEIDREAIHVQIIEMMEGGIITPPPSSGPASVAVVPKRKLKNKTDKKRQSRRLYQPGDLVLVARTLRKTKLTKKPLPRYIGPFRIVKRVSPLTYLVKKIPA